MLTQFAFFFKGASEVFAAIFSVIFTAIFSVIFAAIFSVIFAAIFSVIFAAILGRSLASVDAQTKISDAVLAVLFDVEVGAQEHRHDARIRALCRT
jgi:hypothetical protein